MLPRSIYEALPYLYFLFGIFALFAASPIYGKACALLLIVNAIHIYKLRKSYRKS